MKINKIMCQHILCDERSYKRNPFCIDCEEPVFSFAIEAEGDEYGISVERYRLLVSEDTDLLAQNVGDVWDSGTIESGNISAVKYDGKELASKTTYYFKIIVTVEDQTIESDLGIFTTGLYYLSDWKCGLIGLPLEATPKLDCPEKDKIGRAAPYLRRSFNIDKPVKSAKAYATAFGVYELYINGEKDCHYELAPEWTDYAKSLQYQYYDLTDRLQQGENVIGAVLGDGWFAGNIAGVGRAMYGDAPLGLMFHLSITYEDGTEEIITSDGLWKGTSATICYTDNQTGEYYDATLEKEGWCAPGYTPSEEDGWQGVIGVFSLKIWGYRLKASVGPQVRVMKEIAPVDITVDKNGNYIIDMGQNMVGKAEILFRGKKGQRITLRHGEMLNLDGTLYTENLRSALQTDTYIMKGATNGEVYRPHFTFHGFRYIEISGLDYKPALSDVKGIVIYSGCETTGNITTSNPMVNKLFKNAMWGQMGNFVGVPTDCPQRDERMGWTGDAQVFCRTACYNMDCFGFFDKYGEDILEARKPNGSVTDVVPHVKWPNGNDLVGNGNAAWGDVMFVLPITLYEMYGDITILQKNYGAMKDYFKYLLLNTTDLLRPESPYGDWLSVGEDTPKDVVSTAFFAYDATLMSRAAAYLGKEKDKIYYDNMFGKIKDAWQKAYLSSDGTVKGDTQCCYVLALKMDLTDDKALTAKLLARAIERMNYHLSTGFVGVSYLLPVLCDNGYSDLAYRLLQNDTYPSWGYSIKNGATTIWERWNSYTKEEGFGDVGMNSFNHYSLGSVSEWMYSYMGGIKPIAPGFKHFTIKPYFSSTMDNIDVNYESINGNIRSAWHHTGDNLTELNVEIPANCIAEIILPQCASAEVTAPIRATFTPREGIVLPSGKYTIMCKR
ncbi:MAG: family 78 glycoside hydrolase catalytic domain [Clostridia bacterium]|nr:family 78 glycoside hydrolase catalytic domain [Clostridia bacterium]